jgi:hypothetical protein
MGILSRNFVELQSTIKVMSSSDKNNFSSHGTRRFFHFNVNSTLVLNEKIFGFCLHVVVLRVTERNLAHYLIKIDYLCSINLNTTTSLLRSIIAIGMLSCQIRVYVSKNHPRILNMVHTYYYYISIL